MVNGNKHTHTHIHTHTRTHTHTHSLKMFRTCYLHAQQLQLNTLSASFLYFLLVCMMNMELLFLLTCLIWLLLSETMKTEISSFIHLYI